jgi:O-antigen/teichoic acid export membrane protein
LYAAADRLTRAAAHVGLIATQSLLNMAVRWHGGTGASNDASSVPRLVPWMLAGICLTGAAMVALLAHPVVALLYGAKFADSTLVLQALGVWLGFYLYRNASVVLWLTSKGRLACNVRLQWQEGLSVSLCSAVGSLWLGALGVALGLVLVEVGLLIRLAVVLRSEPANKRAKGSDAA